MHARTRVVVVAAALLSACSAVGSGTVAPDGLPPSAAPAPAPVAAPAATHPTLTGNEAAVAEALDAMAAAFLAADAQALRPWLADPDSGFGQRWLARAEALTEVPLSTYTLRLDTSGADLTTADVPGDGQLLVNVLEEHQLEGFDVLGPLREHLFLTVRRADDGRWQVVGDTDGEALGLVSADHLWDHGPVTSTRRGPLLALHHPGQASVDVLLDEAEAALATTDARWPLAWPSTVPLLVPSDQEELAELLHVTFDLSNFIAFASATPIGELGASTLSGSRVVLNTERFLSRSSETRERILVHELVHAASRPSSAAHVPSWLEEGVAQAIGEQRSTTGTQLLEALSDGDPAARLPLDAEFSAGDRTSIFLSYQRAWSFVDWLVEEHGAATVGTFYEAAGAGAVGRPGTAEAHVDAAARTVFERSLDELVAAWRATL